MRKEILGIPPVIILICFFLPWFTVSCSGGFAGVSVTGYEAATGNVEGAEDEDTDGDLYLFAAPLAALAGLGLVFAQRLFREGYIAAGVGGLIVHGVYYLQLQGDIDDARQMSGEIINVSWEIGWWISILAFIAMIVLGMMYQPEPEPPPYRPPDFSPPPGT
jgi:hypothetical protein